MLWYVLCFTFGWMSGIFTLLWLMYRKEKTGLSLFARQAESLRKLRNGVCERARLNSSTPCGRVVHPHGTKHPQQLAKHIDDTCGLHNTGGVSAFFNEDGTLRACQPGENIFAFNIACSLVIYEEDEHDDYLMNVWNMIEGDIQGLNDVQRAVDSFKLPEVVE